MTDILSPDDVRRLADVTPEALVRSHERLREALTWAVGFIRCNLPKTSAEYPDMRNAEGLVAGRNGLLFGEFNLESARAEAAENEVKRLRAEVDRLRPPATATLLRHAKLPPGWCHRCKAEACECPWKLRSSLRYGSEHMSFHPTREAAEAEANECILVGGNVGRITSVVERVVYFTIYPEDE